MLLELTFTGLSPMMGHKSVKAPVIPVMSNDR